MQFDPDNPPFPVVDRVTQDMERARLRNEAAARLAEAQKAAAAVKASEAK